MNSHKNIGAKIYQKGVAAEIGNNVWRKDGSSFTKVVAQRIKTKDHPEDYTKHILGWLLTLEKPITYITISKWRECSPSRLVC